MRVLVVDDDPAIVEVFCRILEYLGHMPIAMVDAPRAAVTCEPFDVAFIDYWMPGMSGLEVAAELALTHPRARRVLFTATPWEEEVQKALAGGLIHKLVVKPPALVDLENALSASGS